MNTRQGIPLRPDRSVIVSETMRSLARAVIATGLRAFDAGAMGSAFTTKDFLKARDWSDDRIAGVLVRAASTPAALATTGWARELAVVATAFLQTLRPMSAVAQLVLLCSRLSLDDAALIKVLGISGVAASWIAEGAPIRAVRGLTSDGPVLEPHKLASLCELSREMLESSNAEQIVSMALVDAAALALDQAMFSNVAADTLRPAGVLVGATSVTASTAANLLDAMGDDISKLVQAISPYAGNGSIAIIAAPAQATRLGMFTQNAPFTLLMSSALATGSVIALATNALVSAIEPVQLDAAKSVSFHSEDSTPLPVGTASPHYSTFQRDTVLLRMKLPATWTMRAAPAVAFVTATKW